MDPKRLLEQFLGAETATKAAQAARGAGVGGMAGALAAGGILGLLLGSKKARKTAGKLAGGAAGYGGAAALGALGYRAYQQWQASSQGSAPAAPAPDALPGDAAPFMAETAPARDGRPFELALVMAMIAAANADGHIGPEEQRTIFDRVAELPFDAEDKAFIFDTLRAPPSLADIAALASGPEQATELYLASRVAIDLDHPAEYAYLDALAGRLELPPALVAQLESEVAKVG